MGLLSFFRKKEKQLEEVVEQAIPDSVKMRAALMEGRLEDAAEHVCLYASMAATELASVSDIQIVGATSILLIVFYLSIKLLLLPFVPKSTRPRRQAWIITFASAVVMSAMGVYFAVRLYHTDGGLVSPALGADLEMGETDRILARSLALFFLAYCIVDVVVGVVDYPSELGMAVSHHSMYAVLILYLLHTGKTMLFAVFALEELPTLVLSVYEIIGDRRPRLTTGLLILTMRISYHLYVTYACMHAANTVLFLFSVYLLLHHIAWFRSWFVKRVTIVRDQQVDNGLSLSVTTHVYLVTLLLAAQTLMHGALMVTELRETMMPKADWTERNLELLRLVLAMAAHVLCFFMVTVRMVGILQDVYTEHFIMDTIENKTIIYNISWEDPRVERELIKINSSDVILTISSAGCNVLDYLCDSPKAIVACDFNIAQLAVLELKLACIKKLPYEQFWAIWAESDYQVFTAVYKKTLRPILSKNCAEFWDENDHLIRDNFMFAGTSGLAAKLLMPALRFLGLRDYMLQRKLYPPANVGLAVVRSFLAMQWLWVWLAPLGGVPKSQLDLVKREPHVWSERLEEVVGRRMWMPDNYFYYAYIAGRWDKTCCPRYMEEKYFNTLRNNANRVTLHHGPIAQAAQTRNDFTFASLLDSMDWMPDSMIAEQFAALIPQMVPEHGHIFWRSFATKVHSPVLASLLPTLVPDDDGRERVGWYLSQWIAKTPKKADYSKFTCSSPPAMIENTIVQDAAVMTAMAVHALRPVKDVKAFYKSQGTNYDGFREALLPDRDLLLKYCLPWHHTPKTWLSVGCGTARDIEYVTEHVKACGTRVYLLDLSPELLDMAKSRVQQLGIGQQVTLVEADITKCFDKNGKPLKGVNLPPQGSFDIVTCSYCLTMIPPWAEALEAMVKCVKTGGTLALIDFTQRTDTPTHWSQKLNTWWFANDGVYFNVDQCNTLLNHPELSTVWFGENEARVPYTALEATHYTWSGIKVSQSQAKRPSSAFPSLSSGNTSKLLGSS